MKVLVTGHTGFLGSHLVTELGRRGHEVTGLSLSGGRDGIACDLTDAGATRDAVRGLRLDSVVNLAGIAGEARAWGDPAETFRANVRATWNLLEAVAGKDREERTGRFLLGSSATVYGRAGGVLTESTPVEPATPYGASKAAAEVLAGQYGRWTGTPVALARTFNLIGPGMPPTSLAGELALAVSVAEREGREEVRVAIRNPDSKRDFLDARDAARALALILEGEVEEAVNVCSGQATRVSEVVEAFRGLTGVRIETDPGTPPDGRSEIEELVGSRERVTETTGWEPGIDLAESLEAGLEVFRQSEPG